MNCLLLPKKNSENRVWEVDFLRGILILFVVFDHVMFDLGFMFRESFTTNTGIAIGEWAYNYAFERSAFGLWRNVTHDFFIGLFVLVSGISVTFSKNNGLRGVKLAAYAMALTAVTAIFCDITKSNAYAINFNVLHVLALSILLWSVLERFKLDGEWIFLIAVAAIAVGSYFNGKNPLNLIAAAGQKQLTRDMFFWLVNNTRVNVLSPGDYLPFLPYLGWFLLGGLVGRSVYKKPFKSIISYRPIGARQVCWCGRHSLLIYFASQVLAIVLLYLLVVVLAWL